VVEFDKSEQEESRNSENRAGSGRAEIVKMRPDAVVRRAQDKLALLTARFDVTG
jgi:hypothetical protein